MAYSEIEDNLTQVIKDIESGDENKALSKLFETFQIIAKHLSKKFN